MCYEHVSHMKLKILIKRVKRIHCRNYYKDARESEGNTTASVAGRIFISMWILCNTENTSGISYFQKHRTSVNYVSVFNICIHIQPDFFACIIIS